MSRSKVLVTGGAGYIGSHLAQTLLEHGQQVVVLDNLSTGIRRAVPKGASFVKGDLNRPEATEALFKKYAIDTVMHCAASIVVPESVADPLKYFSNNVGGTLNLVRSMLKHGVRRMLFSSTAAVYGEPENLPVREDHPTFPKNPYGWSKLMAEKILEDAAAAHDLRFVVLRYFNAGGAHPSGRLGQLSGTATHLVANALRVARGKKPRLTIYGDDYPTPDGTCIRDYVHVLDICQAHLLAMQALRQGAAGGVFNLGCEKGYSVKQVVAMVEKVTGKRIRMKTAARRPGDPARVVASSGKIRKVLRWKPSFGLYEIIRSAWAASSK